MKSRVIFTVYIDPKEIYDVDEVFSTVEEQKIDFKSKQLVQWFKALTYKQEEYAKKCGADYKIYKIDDAYKTLRSIIFAAQSFKKSQNLFSFFHFTMYFHCQTKPSSKIFFCLLTCISKKIN